MRRLWLLVCFALCIGNIGCFLDDMRRDDGHIKHFGVSSQARRVEQDMDWGPDFER